MLRPTINMAVYRLEQLWHLHCQFSQKVLSPNFPPDLHAKLFFYLPTSQTNAQIMGQRVKHVDMYELFLLLLLL